MSANALRMRRHREEMELALRERMTLDQARAQLDSYREHLPRLRAETISCFAVPPAPTLTAEPDEEDRRMWWQRD